jgi:hypothetical protein
MNEKDLQRSSLKTIECCNKKCPILPEKRPEIQAVFHEYAHTGF